MTFVSYAQNFEDVLLNRVLRGVESGTYIDVGAADPELDSVTKAFYDDGWSGINIDPLPASFLRLSAQRSRDVNLQLAVGSEEGEATFHIVDAYPELSTTVSTIADQYADSGRIITDVQVRVRTLAAICAEYITGPVHFLKIDVEGAEMEVLGGADFVNVRPWIVLVESVTFGAETVDAPTWDSLLREANYVYVYFDGLNRFYVAAEHSSRLSDSFTVPVNARDNFTVATNERSKLAVSRVSELLGLDSEADVHELIERATMLISDRISFENQAIEASRRLLEIQAEQKEAHRTIAELDAMRQQSFEREKYIAWLAMERAQLRTAVQELAANHDRELKEVTLQRDEAVNLAHSLRTSSSWRIALPLRAARHPLPYLRKLLER